jgi:two-component system chemotaxis response regulator CheB
MRNHNIVVIGTSAGGVHALRQLLQDLPATLNASLFIVLHISPQSQNLLPGLLQSYTHLVITSPTNGQPIRQRHIYIAPPNYHMLIERGCIRLTQGPRVNHSRPAIDPLFRSAAIHYGKQVIGVILTGMLDDGTAGLGLIKTRGGITVVQNPKDAEHADMPRNALQNVLIDHCLPLAEIAPLIMKLTNKPLTRKATPVTKAMKIEAKPSAAGITSDHELNQLGVVSSFTCPECHGTLWEINNEKVLHYRCRIGHAYNAHSLIAAHDESVENILWSAVRALEENAALSQRVATRAGKERVHTAKIFNKKARVATYQAQKLKEILLKEK